MISLIVNPVNCQMMVGNIDIPYDFSTVSKNESIDDVICTCYDISKEEFAAIGKNHHLLQSLRSMN